MLRELTQQELAAVAGGAFNDITEVIPAEVPGYQLVGWSQQIIGIDTIEWTEYVGFWGTPVKHVDTSPIYEIKPLYMPLTTVTTIYY